MKKILAIITVLFIVTAIVIPTYAVTPTIKVPSVKIPDIKVPEIKISDSFWDKWFDEHPIVIPEASELALGIPEITNAHYTHSRSAYTPSNLKIEWTAVDGAERYEVLITLANGETITYTETDTSVFDSDIVCPQLVNSNNDHIAHVKVRAVVGDVYGEWSAEDTISCNAFHFG